MSPLTPPRIAAVEVIASQPTEADRGVIAHLSALASAPLPEVAYLVKIAFEEMPPVTSQGWALYVNDVLIPKYWEYNDGIYFTILDPQFFAEHKGKRLRFSQNGVDFYDSGVKLPAPAAASKSKSKAAKSKAAKSKTARLPLQADVLK